MLGVAVHWEVAAPREDHARCAAQVAEVRAYHLSKGYSDIAYNWLACTHGGLFQGRGWGRISGANGTTFANLNYWAICAMTGPDQPHTPELKAALGRLVAEALARSDPPDEVSPHSRFFNTACPGDTIRSWIVQGFASAAPITPEEESMRIVAFHTPGFEVVRNIMLDARGIVDAWDNGGGVPAGGVPAKRSDHVAYGVLRATEAYVNAGVPFKVLDAAAYNRVEALPRSPVATGGAAPVDVAAIAKATADLIAARIAA